MVSRFRSLHIAWKGAILLGVLSAIYLLFGFFAVGPLARHYLEAMLAKQTRRTTTIERIDFNPLALSVDVQGFSMLEPDSNATFVSVGRLRLNVSSSSLFILGPYVQDLELTEPYVHIALKGQGKYNFSDIVATLQTNGTEPNKPVQDEAELFPWLLENFTLDKGRIVFDDEIVGARHELDKLEARIPFTSTLKKYRADYTTPYLTGMLNGTPFRLEGQTLPFEPSLRTEFDIELDGMDLRTYWKYVPLAQSMKLNKGVLHSDLRLVFERSDKLLPILSLQGNASISDFSLSPLQGDPFLAFSRLDLDLRRVRPLLRIFQFNSIVLDSPFVALTRDKNGTLDLVTRFVEPFAPGVPAVSSPEAKPKASPAPPETRPEIILDTVTLRNGKLDFTDNSGQSPFKKNLRDLNVTVSGFTLDPLKRATFTGDILLSADEHLKVAGSFSPAPFDLNATITARGLDIPSYAPYYAPYVPVRVDSGKAGLHAGVFVGTTNGTQVLVSNATTVVEILSLADPKKKQGRDVFFNMQRFSAANINLDLAEKHLDVGRVFLENATTRVVREKDGNIHPVRLFTESAALETPPARQQGNEPEHPDNKASDNATSPEKTPFKAAIGSVALRGWDVTFTDRAAPGKTNIRLFPLDIEMANISTDTSQTMQVAADMRVHGQEENGQAKGELRLKAELRPVPLALQGTLEMRNLPLDIANGYIPADASLRLSGGDLDIKGSYALAQNNDAAKPSLNLDFQGGLEIEDLEASHLSPDLPLAGLTLLDLQGIRFSLRLPGPDGSDNAADESKQTPKTLPDLAFQGDMVLSGARMFTVDGHELASLETVNATQIAFAQLPRTLSIGSLRVHGPRADLVRLKDGRMNTSRLYPEKDGNATTTAGTAGTADTSSAPATEAATDNATSGTAGMERPLASLRITNATLDKGSLRFTDNSVQPQYVATVTDFTGQMDRFSLEPGSRSAFTMQAVVDGQAPFHLEGSTNPLEQAVHTSLQFTIDNFNLPALSPYTIRSLAYPITTGKLHGRTTMTVADRNITANNVFLLDRFTLGRHTPSPDAANVPIKLALALLQDVNGDIQLDVPIQGSLDDPNFRLGTMVMRAIIGLFSNIVTSPFNLLGSIVGLAADQREDISVVEFAPGDTALTQKEMNQLSELGKAMQKRPRLEMVVEGFVGPVKDAEAIGLHRLDVELDKLHGGHGPDAQGNVPKVTGPARAKLLKKAFSKAGLKVPEGVRALPPEKMERMLVQSMAPTGSELAELAKARAQVVRDYFTGQAGIDAKRIFLKFTQADVPPRLKGGSPCRVEMSVK